jgi:Tetratricopeptide repeat
MVQSMKKPLCIWVATILLSGCKGDAEQTAAGAAPTSASVAPVVKAAIAPAASGSASAAAKPTKKKRAKTREAPNPARMAEYRKHLTEGRLLTSKSQFPEAMKEFEKALEAVPGDAPALLDLGWVAFKAGELDKAKKKTEEALGRTTNPQLKGMAHYNLGRVAEEKKEFKGAVDHYQVSIELRPNEIVEKRLAEVAKKNNITIVPKPAVEPLPCQTPVASVADVCACMIKPQPDDMAPRTCEQLKEVKVGRDDLAFIDVAVSNFEIHTYAVGKGDGGFMPIAKVGWEYNPGAFGIFEEFELAPVTEKMAGKTKVLWIDGIRNRHDSDMGIDEYEEETSRLVTLCVPPAGDVKTWKCPVSVPTEMNHVRDRMGLEGFAPDEETRKLMTKGLPFKSSWSLDIKLSEGKADVTVASGKPPAEVQAKARSYPL